MPNIHSQHNSGAAEMKMVDLSVTLCEEVDAQLEGNSCIDAFNPTKMCHFFEKLPHIEEEFANGLYYKMKERKR